MLHLYCLGVRFHYFSFLFVYGFFNKWSDNAVDTSDIITHSLGDQLACYLTY